MLDACEIRCKDRGAGEKQLMANPKSEFLNPKQIRMFKIQNVKEYAFALNIRYLNFDIV